MFIQRCARRQANPAIVSVKCFYHNLGKGKFKDVSLEAGPGIQETVAGRGCAIGDFDNDGNLDILVNCVKRRSTAASLPEHFEEQLAEGKNGGRQIETARASARECFARPKARIN